jgi:hypothetical protein
MHGVFRGEQDFLRMVIAVTIAFTNFHICKRPLSCSVDEPESSGA